MRPLVSVIKLSNGNWMHFKNTANCEVVMEFDVFPQEGEEIERLKTRLDAWLESVPNGMLILSGLRMRFRLGLIL